MRAPKTSTLLWIAVLLAAAAVRVPTVTAALPYFNYVDEGHVLHHSVDLLARGTWDPGWYTYPSLPIYAVAAAGAALSPFYRLAHGRPMAEDFPPVPSRWYDLVGPPELLVAARLMTLVFSLGIVVLTGRLAARLAGPRAGLVAAWLAALLPALVIRGGIVTVDPYATFFVLAALLAAESMRSGPRPLAASALAGVAIGLAAASKYPSVLVCLPVALAALWPERASDRPWRLRFGMLSLAGAASMAAVAVGMPALALKTGDVLRAIRAQSAVYAHQPGGSAYWEQALLRAEWDQPLNHPELGFAWLALAAGGLAVALADRRWRRPVAGWLLFGVATCALLAPYAFTAFRNLLALVPPSCVLVALLYARIRERLRLRDRPRGPAALDLAAAVLPVALFAVPLAQYAQHQVHLEDSRELAIRWLAEHVEPGDRVLTLQDLVILPDRLASLGVPVAVRSWERTRPLLGRARHRWVVLGDLRERDGRPLPPRVRRAIERKYEVRASFGFHTNFLHRGAFRGNHQLVTILERRPDVEGWRGRKR